MENVRPHEKVRRAVGPRLRIPKDTLRNYRGACGHRVPCRLHGCSRSRVRNRVANANQGMSCCEVVACRGLKFVRSVEDELAEVGAHVIASLLTVRNEAVGLAVEI